jgi:CBS domain-containing protein/heme-degrading monooxygenase HmoA
MNAFLTARRIKKGQEEEFRKRWKGGDSPEGFLDAYLLEDQEDPRETLSISFWDTAKDLLAYRTSEDAKKRRGDLDDVVDNDRWSRAFVAFNAVDIPNGGGKKKWLLLPLLLIAAGAAAYYFVTRRKGDDEWDTWQPEPASTYRPDETGVTAVAPITATAANASPQTPPPAVRPMDAEARNGGGHDTHGQRHPDVSADQGAQPAVIQTGALSSTAGAGPVAPPEASASDVQARSSSPSATLGSAPMHAAAMPAGYASLAGQSRAAPSAGSAESARRGRTVREFMTPNPESVGQTDDVVSAARMMRDLDVGVLPVVADGLLAGIVTDRDIAIAFADREADPAGVKVADVMTDMPVTVSPDASVEEAARAMAEHQIRRLPVVDGVRLVGIVSLGDLAADGAQRAAAGALEHISEPAQPDR